MTVNQQRPVNLDLLTLKFPVTAIASILHRISGVVLFFLMPVMLYWLGVSLSSAEGFERVHQTFSGVIWKGINWSFCVALLYHLFAGIRHIVMDLGFGESLSVARRTANGVIIMTVFAAVALGVWIC